MKNVLQERPERVSIEEEIWKYLFLFIYCSRKRCMHCTLNALVSGSAQSFYYPMHFDVMICKCIFLERPLYQLQDIRPISPSLDEIDDLLWPFKNNHYTPKLWKERCKTGKATGIKTLFTLINREILVLQRRRVVQVMVQNCSCCKKCIQGIFYGKLNKWSVIMKNVLYPVQVYIASYISVIRNRLKCPVSSHFLNP